MKFINLERDSEKSGSLIFMTYNPYERRMFDRVEKDGFMPFIYELEDDEMSNERITIRAIGTPCEYVSINDELFVYEAKLVQRDDVDYILATMETYFNLKDNRKAVYLSDIRAALGAPLRPGARDFIFVRGQGWKIMPDNVKYDPNTANDIEKKRNEFDYKFIYEMGEYTPLDNIKKMTRDEVIEKAKKIISGERQGQYGKPEDSFKKIAEMWSTYLGTEIKSSDVAAMMVLMKTARISGGVYKDDNWVDIIGYAALGAEIQAREEEDDI